MQGPEAPLVEAVVWDLGGVLIDWDPRYLYRSLFDDEAEMEHFLANVTTPEWNRAQDAGRPWVEAIEELAQRHPEQRELIAAYWERWHETLGDAHAATVEVLRELRATGIRQFALTNWSGETFPVARPDFAFLEWFEGIVVSGDERLIKPDPAIFRLVVERYDLEPTTTVFIDDQPDNVRAAGDLGFVAIRFVDAASLRGELRRLGLLAPSGA